MYIGIIPLRLYILIKLISSIGLSIIPIQLPFTNIFELLPNWSEEHSNKLRIGVFTLSHLIKLRPDDPLVIWVLIAICLCRPIFPPSGVSTGSINPHWDEFNRRGPTTFALESKGKFILRKCEINVYQLRRSKPCTTPRRFVWVSEPQFPLNALRNPFSTVLSLKNVLKLDSIRLMKLSLYLFSLFSVFLLSFLERTISSSLSSLYSPLW